MESGCNALSCTKGTHLFQFPTNGKGHGKPDVGYGDVSAEEVVSIPYEREGAWKEDLKFYNLLKKKFQFPTNGKGHGKQ